MNKVPWLIACSLLLAPTGASRVAAQVRWGSPEAPREGVCFYEDADFRGRSFCARAGEEVADLPRGMNDRISSIRLFGETEVVVYADGRFRGRSARFATDVRNLQREGWNDAISSVRVSSGSRWDRRRGPEWGRFEMPREGACFFRDAGFRGEAFCVARGGSYASMPPGFNDQISSIRVRDANVIIFSDGEFGGRSRRIDSDVPNLGEGWNDRISSLRVY